MLGNTLELPTSSVSGLAMTKLANTKIAQHVAAKLLGQTSCAQCQFLWYQEEAPDPYEAWGAFVHTPHCALGKAFLEDADRNTAGVHGSRCPEFSQRLDPRMRTMRREFGNVEGSHDLYPRARKKVMSDIRKFTATRLKAT